MDLLDAPTVLAACCGLDLCHKYSLYLYWYLYLEVKIPKIPNARRDGGVVVWGREGRLVISKRRV